jgi:hypothetical protein
MDHWGRRHVDRTEPNLCACRFPAFQRIQHHLARAAHPEEGVSSEEALAVASAATASEDVVFMRWKERSFDSKHTETCGLTIQVPQCLPAC